MMPLAFDLSSTLVTGSTFPVATTERTIVPCSMVAILDGSIGLDAPLSVEKPQTPAMPITIAAAAIRLNFRDFLIRSSLPAHHTRRGDYPVDEQETKKVAADRTICGSCEP